MAGRKKRRVLQHLMEDKSYEIIKEQIPKAWVIREFNRPDYGIDLVIELFDVIDGRNFVAETLGEYVFVQVKSVLSVEVKKEKIYPVSNVAKGTWQERKDEYMEIDVIKYSLDTNTLVTVQEVGASISTLLFVVDLSTSIVYFICLNDLIEKIILPQKPNYSEQDFLTLTIPVENNLNNEAIRNRALEFYGKRAKLLAAFSKFYYQKNEILHLFEGKEIPIFSHRDVIEKRWAKSKEDIIKQLNYFIQQIEHLDIWDFKYWAALKITKNELDNLKQLLAKPHTDRNNVTQASFLTWHSLCNLGNMYEEICREWFLPKFLSFLTSYPTHPEIIKTTP